MSHDSKENAAMVTTSAPLAPADRTRLETLHGDLLREAAAEPDFYDASVARFRAAVIAKALGWDVQA